MEDGPGRSTRPAPSGNSAGGGDNQDQDEGVAGEDGNGDGANPDIPENWCEPIPPYQATAGTYPVGTVDYELPTIRFSVETPAIAVRARVYYPALEDGAGTKIASDGPFPVIVMLHGNHPRYRAADGSTIPCTQSYVQGHHKTLAEIQEQFPDATEIANHLGYAYLGSDLARAGYVFVSIDGNDVNCIALNGGFNKERAELVRRHVEALAKAFESPTKALKQLSPGFDTNRMILAGHSRGGEAVILAAGGEPIPGASLKGVISIAPTDFLLDSASKTLQSSLMVVVPAADGDVSFNGGLRYYDLMQAASGASGWFKAQQYVHGANHNFFNSEWNETFTSCGVLHRDGDNGVGNGSARLTRAAQQQYLVAATRAYLDALFTDSRTARALLAGNTKIQGQESLTISASYAESWPTFTMPTSVTASGFDEIRKYPLTHTTGAYNDTFFHFTTGYVGAWSGMPASFSVAAPLAPPPKVSFVSLRVAQVVDGQNEAGRRMALEIELEDESGRIVRAPSDWAEMKIPPWYARPVWKEGGENCEGAPAVKTVLSTVKIPAACFKGDRGFLYEKLKTLRVHVRDEAGVLAFTDFQVAAK